MALPSLRRSGEEQGGLGPSRGLREPFTSLRRDMERLFEGFSRVSGWGPPALAGANTAPRIEASETASESKIEAALPGVEEFARSIGLPFEADAGKIKASFATGALNVTVPKPAEIKATEKKLPIGEG